ncbi:dihydrolipoyl dehydrogenase [Paracoccus shandongensis]|uniref:dihydrolipoyl dehydrogenase n=1 Tax=Paracoccus shandongensis TaxID=2816048 RepID=UPI001A8E01A5|nr:dihydrolipoyl dehydrogenase [Paracoccus shandongensis]
MTDTTPDLSCDVAIIGAGTAGLAAERAARAAGARTLLIDDGFRGTLCASAGCMPSKLLIAAAHAHAGLDRARMMGIDIPKARVDGRRVMERLRTERDRFVQSVQDSFRALPPGTCIDARARFVARDRLELDDGRQVAPRAVVIATGSMPVIPKPYRNLGPRMLTNESIFELEDLPESLAVIGAGPLGAELAQAMGRLGVRVAMFDKGGRLAGIRCDRLHDAFREIYARDVTLHLGRAPKPSAQGNAIRLAWNGGAGDFSHVLVATGRAPALDGLNLKATGLALDDKGVPRFDRVTMQCGDAAIFMAGDADADAPVLHEARLDGIIAGTNAARFPAVEATDRPPLFTITFTDPPIAAIGAPPDECVLDAHASYADQGRARVEGKAAGLYRLGADETGRLIGADLAVPGGDHMAHLLAWAITSGASASDVLDLPFYHPTLEEGLKPALRDLCRRANLALRDDGNPPGA